MVTTLTEQPTEQERDRKAWNLPRASVPTAQQAHHRAGLDWDSFRDLYYPSTHRHDFEAIVAYGNYKRSPQAGLPATNPSDVQSLAEWEAEGGSTTLPPPSRRV